LLSKIRKFVEGKKREKNSHDPAKTFVSVPREGTELPMGGEFSTGGGGGGGKERQ